MQSLKGAERGCGRLSAPKRPTLRRAQPQDVANHGVTPALVATVGAAAVVALPALANDAGVSADAVTAAGAIVGVAGLGGVLVATDPQRRRNAMAQGAGGDEMASVKEYFETSGARDVVALQLSNLAAPTCDSVLLSCLYVRVLMRAIPGHIASQRATDSGTPPATTQVYHPTSHHTRDSDCSLSRL